MARTTYGLMVITHTDSANIGECGDGEIEVDFGEECDSSNLGGKTCADFGFPSGSLACSGECKLDTSGCIGECASIAGTWNVSETVNITCAFDGATETETLSGRWVINIEQNGCDVNWTVPDFNVDRTGTVQGNDIRVSGPSVIPVVGNATFTENTFIGQGLINGNEFTLDGLGTATGTAEGINFSCISTSRAVFTRSSEDVSMFAGTYVGTFSGDDSGTFTVVIDTVGNVSGSGVSAEDGPFAITGTVNSTGGLELVAGTATTGATFSGTISPSGEISGTWENRFFGESGTFTGSRQ